MKIRTDYVTNSSSSSFILSFCDEKDYQEFKEYCEECNYNEIFELIDSFRQRDLNGIIDEEGDVVYKKRSLDEIRKKSLESLERFFTHEAVYQYLKERTKDISDFVEKIKEEERIKTTQEYKDFYNSLFVERNYNQELKDYIDKKEQELGEKDMDIYMKIISSPEYLALKEDLKYNRMYFKGKEKVEKDSIIVEGMIWDTDGGILEWAIRNGLLESEFYRWTDMVWNIG